MREDYPACINAQSGTNETAKVDRRCLACALRKRLAPTEPVTSIEKEGVQELIFAITGHGMKTAKQVKRRSDHFSNLWQASRCWPWFGSRERSQSRLQSGSLPKVLTRCWCRSVASASTGMAA